MKVTYQVNHQAIEIVYAEALPVILNREAIFFTDRTILLVTNQVYYDNYYDIFSALTKEAKNVYWYICPNHLHSNQFSELEELLTYLTEINLPNDTELIGFGNVGIYHLSNFLSANRPEIVKWTYIPTDLQAFQVALSGEGQIELSYDQIGLAICNNPNKIFFDSTITVVETFDFRLYELLVPLRIGIISDYDFLQELFRAYPEKKQILKLSLGTTVPTIIQKTEIDQTLTLNFGKSFTKGLRNTPGSHLLSSLSKQIIGLMLHLVVSQQLNDFAFQTENFFKWLLKLGYQLSIPSELLSTDLAQAVWRELNLQQSNYFISTIGKADLQVVPSELQLSEAIQIYRDLIKEIKETTV